MHARGYFIIFLMVTASAIPLAGQPRGLGDVGAFQPDPFAAFRHKQSPGTVSVVGLRKPLKGKALKTILTAQKHLQAGETARAMDILEAAREDAETAAWALALLGTEHLKQQRFEQAVLELEESVRDLPDNPATQSNLAYALVLSGHAEKALPLALRSLQIDPGGMKTRYVLAQILIRLGRLKEAKFHLSIAAEEIPGAEQMLSQIAAFENAERTKSQESNPTSSAFR